MTTPLRRGLVVALVLCWPASALGQNPTLDLLATIHDEESLVAASRPLFYDLRPLDTASLRAALDDGTPHVRWIAAMTLAGYNNVPSPELVIPVLVDAIKQGEPGVRKLAFQQLGNWSHKRGYRDICAPVIDDDVIAGLHDPVYEVHTGALRALSSCPSLPVSIAVREIAEYRGQDSNFRLLLISNLGRRGAEAAEAADVLIMALDDESSDTRREAAKALQSVGVDPDLYVPQILGEIRAGEGGRRGVSPSDKLVTIAPAAARWAPDIIEMLRNERSPYMREQLRRALNRIDTPQATSAAASSETKDSLVRKAPWIALILATAVVLGLIVKSGWGVLLGVLFPALPLLAGAIFADNAWHWLPVILAGPICSLVGAVAGFLCASGESGTKRAVGLAGGWISAGAALVYGFLIVALYYGLAPLGAG